VAHGQAPGFRDSADMAAAETWRLSSRPHREPKLAGSQQHAHPNPRCHDAQIGAKWRLRPTIHGPGREYVMSATFFETICNSPRLRALRGGLLARRATLLAVLMVILGGTVGCGPKEFVPAGNADDAKKHVTTVLDAWKAGKKPADLQGGSPPLRAGDHDWEAGTALSAYEMPESPVREGGHWRVPVVLTLVKEGKSPERKVAAYSVTFEPSLAVVRRVKPDALDPPRARGAPRRHSRRVSRVTDHRPQHHAGPGGLRAIQNRRAQGCKPRGPVF